MYWDRDAQVEKELDLPKEFTVVAEGWSVKGYLQDKWGVFSNEIYSFANDILTIRDGNGWIISEWLWKDIKEKTKALGLKLTKNIHYVGEDDLNTLKTLCIKGAWLKAWLDTFKDDNRNAPAFKRIKLSKVEEWKTWAVKYTFPVFEPASDLSAEDRQAQQTFGTAISNYISSTNTTVEEYKEQQAANAAADEDSLPFN